MRDGSWSRRRWLAASVAAGASAAIRASAQTSPLRLRMPLGIDTYSLRSFGWKAFEMIDYAAGRKLDVVQFSELPHLGTMEQASDEGYLRRVRARADEHGVRLETGTWGVCPTLPNFKREFGSAPEQLGLAVRVASILGSKTVRCVMGSGAARRRYGPVERHIDAMIGVCRAVREQALGSGVMIAIENHKDMRAEELRDLIETAGSDYVGVCLDTGNAIEVLEDPLRTVEILAPYVVTSHFRDTVLWKHPRGAAFQWTAMGDGSIGIDRVVKRFAELCPGVPMNLEIITGRAPKVLPFWESEFWQGFEKVPAAEFRHFLKLVEDGHPLMAGMMVPANSPRDGSNEDASYQEAVKQQQRVDLERSIRYCRERLGVYWEPTA